MVVEYHLHVKNYINKIVSYAKKQLAKAQDPLVAKFIRFFYAHISLEDIESRELTDLYGAALSQWELMYQRSPNELKLRVFNPQFEEHGWQSTHTIIQVVMEDMPFLADSMQMELNQRGITTHLMVFTGGLKVCRDQNGNITELLTYDSNVAAGRVESPIYMEVDRQTDQAVLDEIAENLKRVIADVVVSVRDWQPMANKLRSVIEELKHSNLPQKQSEVDESAAFLEWLLGNHFTFIGAREYEVVEEADKHALRLIQGSGLGVLHDDTHSRIYREFSEMPEQARELLLSKEQVLIVSKTNTRSTVHRPAYTDYIGIKRYDGNGNFIGEYRFIGLYTSTAYSSNPKEIPFLREKVASVLKISRLPLSSHAGKDLAHILATLPRDDLFQASVDELYILSIGILHLQERRRIKLFARKDAYGRFMSCLVYMPRENFNTDLLNQVQELLVKEFNGLEVSFDIHFSESILARIHYVVRIEPKNEVAYDLDIIEKSLIEISRSWWDGLRESALEYFGEERGNRILNKYLYAFPAGYREMFLAHNAVFDIEHIEKLKDEQSLGMSFYRPVGVGKEIIKFKLFRLNQTVPLSDALPMLENMGLRVIGEVPYHLVLKNGVQVWINDFIMTYAEKTVFEVEDVRGIFQEAFYKIWLGNAENGSFNKLVLDAQLTWREIMVVRAYAKYLRQVGFIYSPQYIAEALVNNVSITKLLIELFKILFDTADIVDRKQKAGQLESLIHAKLDDVLRLDEDKIIRHYLYMIRGTLRTNYFQTVPEGGFKEYLSFKLNPAVIPELPLPLPKYEIFVYSPHFEGVHLRSGKVARGGIRWSDRREDFRTEVLGLMKAQQVKNAVIVPAGAKGGFVPKNLPVNGTREEIMQEGIKCYKGFIQGLLDLTDNLCDNKVVPPANTVCYDDDDPYLVVAADKGTATFSDIANQIAIDRGFWLGDAFASGGSTGYDHKKMGITARGAWISAQRHFQELGVNVDHTEITVVGIGDMSGDVFGNGLLMSSHIKMVCAFNHQHIFIDPAPLVAQSYEERIRLYNLPRSSWEDYNKKLLSKGGGVYKRSAKSIKLSSQAKTLLDTSKDVLTPNELIKEILRAPVDLIWNGGVGTFVKATTESHTDVGDRANDAVRVNGNELRAAVVCEGGNLGLTQLARVEFERCGGRVNTDFIDNSAGVDCSDHEVNIKILLNSIVTQGELTQKQRNQLLAKMTDEVIRLVLQSNYLQNRGISLASFSAAKSLNQHMLYIDSLEEKGEVNRMLEFLPDNKEMLDRKAKSCGLTRPELSVLFAYTKILLEEHIRNSDLIKDSYLSQYVKNAFPSLLRKRYLPFIEQHHLVDEIISTQISNQLVSDMGITFIFQMQDETGAPIAAIVRAYAVARHVFRLTEFFSDIESLDYKIDVKVQLTMYETARRLVRRATRWLLRTRREQIDIPETMAQFSTHVTSLFRRLYKFVVGSEKTHLEERRDTLIAANVPPEIAMRMASVGPMYHALNIIEVSLKHGFDVNSVAHLYFILVERLELVWFREQMEKFPVETHWAMLAKSAFKGDIDWILRELTLGVLSLEVVKKGVAFRVEAWFKKHHGLIERWENIIADLRSSGPKDFAILSVAIRELSDLAQTSAASGKKEVIHKQ